MDTGFFSALNLKNTAKKIEVFQFLYSSKLAFTRFS